MSYFDRRQMNIEVFEDTLDFIHKNKVLSDSLSFSLENTKIYRENEYPEIKDRKEYDVNVVVTKSRTFEAAINNHKKYSDKKIAVLNFASSTTPGGGVTSGSSAQEESLCRCSTLYPALDTKYLFDNYYLKNRREINPLNNDDIIYIKDITICKSDVDHPLRLLEKEFIKVDVITCAAPNLRDKSSIADEELYQIHLKRAKHILHIAALNNVEILILGAFGCGAFRNDPNVVAKAYKNALEEYKKSFFLIDFAIYTRPSEEENYLTFKRYLIN